MTHRGRSILLLLALAFALPTMAQTEDERITKLEQKLDELLRQAEEIRQELRQIRPATAATEPAPAEDLTAVDVAPSIATVQPVENQTSASAAKALNPDISAIGTFLGHAGDQNDFDPRRSFDLGEAELALEAFIDPYAKGRFFIAVGPEEVELEEGYAQFVTLPWGLTAKAGKTKATFGKANTWHTHTRPWVDQPLMLTRFFGDEGLADVGVSVSKQIDNPFGAFIEATGEVYSDNVYNAHVKFFRDLSENSNLEVGTSAARVGDDRLTGIDVTYRWKPLSRAIYNSFILRAEGIANRDDVHGWYAAADYQLARRWFTGARFDRADRDRAVSATLTFWPSEFSQLRGQYRRTTLGGGPSFDEVLLQLQFAIGAHGAHVF